MSDDTAKFPDTRGDAGAAAADHDDYGQHDTEAHTGTSIARMNEPTALRPTALEDRHLIHQDMEDPTQVDVFRELKLNLRCRLSQDNPVILVTGVGPRCGTTYVAKNLATAIAFDEARTALLIDCNLRRPALGREFCVDADGGGLIEFLHQPAIGLPTIIYPTGVPRLRVIPAGRPRRAAGEFFASFRMRALVDLLRNRYRDRALVIDAPPALGSPDARLLAELVDVVLLVAGDGMHRAEAISDAAKAFPPSKLGGVVFNHVP
jgi:protein-tyrosine kinase